MLTIIDGSSDMQPKDIIVGIVILIFMILLCCIKKICSCIKCF